MTQSQPGLQRFATLTAAMTLVLILAGGFVTSTKTGDTIDTWPHWWGRLEGGKWVEATHRILAVMVGLLTAGLAVWVYRRDSRSWVRRLALLALAAVCVQALLGGIRVGRYYPTATAIVHATFAQVIFCALTAIALFLSPSRGIKQPDCFIPAIATTAFSFLQLVAGAVTRHTGVGLTVHLVNAGLVLLCGSLLASRLMLTPLKRGGLLLLGLLGAQIVLGLATLTITRTGFDRSVEAPIVHLVTVTSHVALGALVLATSLVLTLKCHAAPSELACP